MILHFIRFGDEIKGGGGKNPENEKKKLETKRNAVIKEGYDRAKKILEDNKELLKQN